jgi:beta-galactosidase
MLPHAGPRTRSWQTVVELGSELRSLSGVAGARTDARIAIVLDWNSWWALEMDSRPSTRLSLVAIIRAWYQALWERGFSIDFAHPEGDLSHYDLVLVPQLYLTTDEGGRRIDEAARAGATVVIGFFSGAVDGDDHVRTGGYPQQWQDLLGLWVEEYRPLLPGEAVELASHDAVIGASPARDWSEHVHLIDAEPVLTYVGGDLDGCAAVTRRQVPGTGTGAAWYVSTALDGASLSSILLEAARSAGVTPILESAPPPGAEVALRQTPDESFLFLLNHSESQIAIDVTSSQAPSGWTRHDSSQPAGSPVLVPAGDVVILVARHERTPDPR